MLALFLLNVCPPPPQHHHPSLQRGSSAEVRGSDTGTWHGLSMGCSGPGTRYPIYSQNKHQKWLVPLPCSLMPFWVWVTCFFTIVHSSQPLYSFTPLSRRSQSWHVSQAGAHAGSGEESAMILANFNLLTPSLFLGLYKCVYTPYSGV